MTREKLEYLLNSHDDIELSVHGKRFTIMTSLDRPIFIGEQYKRGEEEKPSAFFDTVEELLDYRLLGNTKLADVLDEVEVLAFS